MRTLTSKLQIFIVAIVASMFVSMTANASVRAYGIRVYDSVTGQQNKLVSFDVTTPDKVVVEYDLGAESIRAAAVRNGKMYMMVAPIATCDAMRTIDLTTGVIETVKNYEVYLDVATSLIFFDMTYDVTTDKFYALAVDLLENSDVTTGDYTLGLYCIDPETGDAQFVGGQKDLNIITIAADTNGDLWGIDVKGNLWDINKRNGLVDDIYESVPGNYSSGIQSACFDLTNNDMYWTSFEGEAVSVLQKFHFTEDMITVQNLGHVADHAEILGLYIDPFAVSTNAPAAATNFTVTPAANAVMSATLKWNNPATDVDGAKIDGKLSVKVYCDEKLVETLSNCEPGAETSYVHTTVTEGSHVYSIVCESANGEGRKAIAPSVYVGEDLPGAVEGLTAQRTGTGFDIQVVWTAPSVGKNNGWFDESTIKYNIVRVPGNKVVAENVTDLTFVDNTITETAGYSYQVIPVNRKGSGVVAESNIVPSGKALEVPYSSNFRDDDDFRLWTIIDGNGDGDTWYRENNYAGTDDWFMKYMSDNMLSPNARNNDWFISAPIHLDADKYYNLGYAIRLLSMGGMFPCNYSIAIGKSNTIEAMTQVLSSVDGEENMVEFVHHDVAVKVDETGDYCIGFQLRNCVPTQITNIELVEVKPADLSIVSFEGTIAPACGNDEAYAVKVMNNGGSDVKDYTVSLVDEEENVLAVVEGAEVIAPSTAVTVMVNWTPTVKGAKKISARVDMDDDQDMSNNVSSAMDVTVLPAGSWAKIGSGTNVTNEMPFNTYAAYSASKTTYYADEVNAKQGQTVNAAVFYFTTLTTARELMMPLRIYAKGEKVFDGKVQLVPSRGKVEVVFDTPIACDGNDLEITICSDYGSIPQGYMFYVTKDAANSKRTYYYNGNKAYDFTQSMSANNQYPNVSLFVADEEIDGIVEVSRVLENVAYDLQGRRVVNPRMGLYVIGGKKVYVNK